MKKISILERYILESIIQAPKGYNKIKFSTGLKDRVLRNALKSLQTKELVSLVSEVYMVNKANPVLVENQETEKEILLKTCINSSCSSKAFIVELSDRDEKLLSTMINNIENFLLESKKKSDEIKKKTVFFWGKQNYFKAIDSLH